MTREDIFGSDVQYIENYVQRVESRLGAGFCWYIREVWNKSDFKKKPNWWQRTKSNVARLGTLHKTY